MVSKEIKYERPLSVLYRVTRYKIFGMTIIRVSEQIA